MSTEKNGSATVQQEITLNNEYQQFIENITLGDGRLIKLNGKISRLGEPYFISARFGEDVVDNDPNEKYLNIDVFVRRGENFVPVGIRDYEITGNIANGNKQRHGHLPISATYPDSQAQQAAERFWDTGEGMHVVDMDWLSYAVGLNGLEGMTELRRTGIIENDDQWGEPVYQKHGLGQLMVAVSF